MNNNIVMEPYATHQPLLMFSMLKMAGSVIEIGAGWYSTPLISAYAAAFKRECVIIEDNIDWAKLFYNYTHKYCQIIVNNYDRKFPDKSDKSLPQGRRWGVAFVDNGPSSRRADDVLRMRNNAKIIVTHDTECSNYNWHKVYNKFKFFVHDKRRNPWTTLFSNIIDVNKMYREWVGNG